jgi:hypothetical protein
MTLDNLIGKLLERIDPIAPQFSGCSKLHNAILKMQS